MIDPQTERIRHSAAHILAMASVRLFPETKLGIGPVTEAGFYYDFEFPHKITWDDVTRIEQEMNLIIQEDVPFSQMSAPKEQAFDILLRRGQVYKAELLRELEDYQVSFFKTGEEFIDLCRGPHIASSGEIGALKLTALSGAYWKGDNNRPQLQRITGIAFESLDKMREYLAKEEAIAKRDFRRLAKDLHLSLGGHRGVVYTPAGTKSLDIIADKVISRLKISGYEKLISPPVKSTEYLFSGLDSYFTSKNRSYKELPIKLYEHNRHELGGNIDIAGKEYSTINTVVSKNFFKKEDLLKELVKELSLLIETLNEFDIRYDARITAPNMEDLALQRVTELLQRSGISQTHLINPGIQEIIIRFAAKDSLKREWVVASLYLGESNKISYVASNGEFTPTSTVSTTWITDKLLAFFLEDKEGELPGWLSPTQIRLVPIAEEQNRYANTVEDILKNAGYRVDVDARSETMQSKIRDAELLKIPAVFVIGDKEVNSNTVSVRLRNRQEIGMVAVDGISQVIAEHIK